jgi:DNA relaxase NicK
MSGQVNAFLTNTGSAKLCEVKLAFDDTQSFFSIWPEWAQKGKKNTRSPPR